MGTGSTGLKKNHSGQAGQLFLAARPNSPGRPTANYGLQLKVDVFCLHWKFYHKFFFIPKFRHYSLFFCFLCPEVTKVIQAIVNSFPEIEVYINRAAAKKLIMSCRIYFHLRSMFFDEWSQNDIVKLVINVTHSLFFCYSFFFLCVRYTVISPPDQDSRWAMCWPEARACPKTTCFLAKILPSVMYFCARCKTLRGLIKQYAFLLNGGNLTHPGKHWRMSKNRTRVACWMEEV